MTVHRPLGAAALVLVLGGFSRSAAAQATADVVADSEVEIDADPVFGAQLRQGQGEIVAHIANHHASAIDGTLVAIHMDWPNPVVDASAAYHLDAGASAVVHLPVNDTAVFFEAKNAKGRLVFQKEIPRNGGTTAIVADVSTVPQLAGAISHAAINPAYRPLTYYGGYGGTDPLIEVVSPRMSPESGDWMLPTFIAGWQGTHLAVIGSDDLARVSGPELEALSGFVLAGGTLAVVRKNRGDLGSPTLTALAGGTVVETPPAPVELETMVPPELKPPNVPKWSHPIIRPEETTEIVGFAGGNLAPSPFGASAPYGLGEVVLLGFDVHSPIVMEDPWVQVRMAELTRRAYERRAIVAADPGMVRKTPSYLGEEEGPYRNVRKLLDPNENARWGIAAGAVLLVGHAVLAGPVAFSRAKKKKKPLLAFLLLPILSIVAFLAIVGLGFIAKGTTSRARRLTFIDAGAGMKRAISRRFRGYYSASSTMLDIAPSTRTSSVVVGRGDTETASLERGTLDVDRDGAYVSGVTVAPWQTLVAREDGIASLGDGVAVTAETGSSEVEVRNGSGHPLRFVIVKLADEEFRFIRYMGAGETVDTGKTPALPVALREWVNAVRSVRSFGRMDVHSLNGTKLAQMLPAVAPETDVGAAWEAVSDCTSEATDWFPRGLPVVIAEVEGGDGAKADAGMRLDWDRTLVRVVGYGGEP